MLQLFGFLGRHDAHRFEGAVDWVRSRCKGRWCSTCPGLPGWCAEGEAAVVRAAGDSLVVCGLRERPAPLLAMNEAVIRIYSGLPSAVPHLASDARSRAEATRPAGDVHC